MYKVKRRGGFSDRNSIKIENTEMQYSTLDERTRNALMNEISQMYRDVYGGNRWSAEENQLFMKNILRDVYSEFVDSRNYFDDDKFFEIIHGTVIIDDYDDVLTLIEAVAQYWVDIEYQYNIYERFNNVFKKEYVGYRFVNGVIVRITDENEIDAINQAVKNPYSAVRVHISKAIKLLSDRDKPDYENSIKESISAVEAVCEILTGVKGKEATLGNMLKKIEDNGIVIHGALKSAFNILYGYTSDANGIRHAGDIGGPTSTFEEAKFMLVSCSAFINYLLSVSAQ